MKTPYGQECPHYYLDTRRWHQGKDKCQLLPPGEAARWSAKLCRDCPVPEIRRVNACPNMKLHAKVGRRPLRFWEKPRILIRATCSKSGGKVKNPYVGCGLCHPPVEFRVVADDEKS